MWLLNYRLLSKVLPVVFLLLVTSLTFILRSVNEKSKKEDSEETNETETSPVEVEIEDESEEQVVEVEIADETEEEPTSVVSTPVTQVDGLPPKAITALQEARILTVEQLSEWTDEELLALKGIGKKSLDKLRNFKI
tara:strand:+ start:13091 stop:13501 length:411 start_codon:yes stop_codon:yes gene_type:complete